jgi:hypothetical protein
VKQRIDLVVLPEIALDSTEFGAMQQALAASEAAHPVLIVGGMMHRSVGTHHVNEAIVMDSRGREIFRHEKIEPFTDHEHGLEAIVPREMTAYNFLETPVGRLVVNICRDVRSDVASILNRALDATVVVVPAYSSRLDFVGGEAPILGQRQRAITVSVNPGTLGPKALRDAAYVYCPIRGARYAQGTQADIGAGGDLTVHAFTLGVDKALQGTLLGPESTAL